MLFKNFVIILSFLFLTTTAFSQAINIASVDGLTSSGNLALETEITFNLRLINDASRNSGITNGFSISSPEGATWGSLVGDTLVGMRTAFDLIFEINTFSTGEGVDTVGFGGAALFGAGLVSNFNEVAYSITIGPIPASDEGKHIVLDSSFYAPSGKWKWAGPDEFASWDGPHVFLIGDAEPRNAAPVLNYIGAHTISEGDNLNFLVSASDSNGDALILSAFTLPAGAEFIDNGDGTGAFNWTPDYNQAAGFFQPGLFDITFSVSDGVLAHEELVTISVDNTNRVSVLDPIGSQSVNENETLSFSVIGSDVDLEKLYLYMSLTFTIDSNFNKPNFIDYGDGTGLFTWTPDFEQAGTYDILFRVGDGHTILQGGLYDEELVTITVNNVNRSPILDPIGDKTVDEGQPLIFRTHATDPDYLYDFIMPQLSINPLPSGANYEDYGDGTGDYIFGWIPDFTQSGTYVITFRASDGELVDEETITITVNDVEEIHILSATPDSIYMAARIGTGYLYSSFILEDSTLQSPLNYTLTENISWLELLDASGTTPDTVHAEFRGTLLGEGIYIDSILVTSPDADNSPFYIKVVFNIVSSPKELIISERTLKFVAIEGHGNPPPQQIIISETNHRDSRFRIEYDNSWILLSNSIGTTPDTIDVNIKIPESLLTGRRYINTLYYYNEGNPDDTNLYATRIQLDYAENLPPQLNLRDSIFYTYFPDAIEIVGSVFDFENDALNLWVEPSLENLTITVIDDEFIITFNPDSEQTGVFNISLHASDGIETTTTALTLQVTPRGDFNLDRTVDIVDLMAVVEFFFLDGVAPQNLEYIDLNNDGSVDIEDLIQLIVQVFGKDDN